MCFIAFLLFLPTHNMDGVQVPGKTVINMPDNNGGMDAATMALLANNNNQGMNSRWPLLLLLGGGRGWGGGFGGGSPAAGAVADSIVLSPAFQSLQTQIASLGNELDSNQILAGITSINQNVSGTSRDIGRDIANLSTAQAAGNFTTLQSINGLGRDVTAQANQNALQQLNSFNQLTTSLLQGFNNQAMQTQNATNQIIAQGTANAAAVAAGFCDISRELSECCCDLKSTIKDDGSLTRALINDLNIQNLRDQLAEAKLSASQTAQTLKLENFIRNCACPCPGASQEVVA